MHCLTVDLTGALLPAVSKICPPERLKEIHLDSKAHGLRTGVCLGCFDILHSGHLLHLAEARNRCDRLFVVVTGDKDINKPGRPYFPQEERIKQIALLAPVDFCCIRPDDIPAWKFLGQLGPSVYYKGSDCAEMRGNGLIAEMKAVKICGGETMFTHAPSPCHSSDLFSVFKEIMQ